MNFFSMNIAPVGRGGETKPGRRKGIIHTVAYNSASCLHDSVSGLIFDFTDKPGVDASWLLDAAGNWLDRQEFWCLVNENNPRKNAILARQLIFALPKELNRIKRLRLTERYCRFIRTTYQVATDVSIHLPRELTQQEVKEWQLDHLLTGEKPPSDNGNYHCHVAISACEVDMNGRPLKRANGLDPIYCRKNGLINPAELLRAKLAEMINEAMAEVGCVDSIDHRSFERQGLTDIEATEHIGQIGSDIKKSMRPCRADIRNKLKKTKRLLKECKTRFNAGKEPDLKIGVIAARYLLRVISLKTQLRAFEAKPKSESNCETTEFSSQNSLNHALHPIVGASLADLEVRASNQVETRNNDTGVGMQSLPHAFIRPVQKPMINVGPENFKERPAPVVRSARPFSTVRSIEPPTQFEAWQFRERISPVEARNEDESLHADQSGIQNNAITAAHVDCENPGSDFHLDLAALDKTAVEDHCETFATSEGNEDQPLDRLTNSALLVTGSEYRAQVIGTFCKPNDLHNDIASVNTDVYDITNEDKKPNDDNDCQWERPS